MSRKKLSDCYITATEIAESWNQSEDSQEKMWTGEGISRRYRRILDALVSGEKHSNKKGDSASGEEEDSDISEGEDSGISAEIDCDSSAEETNDVRSIFKSASENEKNVNNWIFYNSSVNGR